METLLLLSSGLLWLIVLGNLLLILTVIRRLNAGFPREKPSSTGLRVVPDVLPRHTEVSMMLRGYPSCQKAGSRRECAAAYRQCTVKAA